MPPLFASTDNKSKLLIEYDLINMTENNVTQHLTNMQYIDGDQIKQIKQIKQINPTLFINPPIKIFGKVARQRRSVGFFSDISQGYKYSGQFLPSQPLPEWMNKILLLVNKKFNTSFNAILINYYMNGNDYISAHSDDEQCLSDGYVATLSFGAERTFVIRDKTTRYIEYKTILPHNSLALMTGNFQKLYTHEIPKDKSLGPRWSLTFRYHKI